MVVPEPSGIIHSDDWFLGEFPTHPEPSVIQSNGLFWMKPVSFRGAPYPCYSLYTVKGRTVRESHDTTSTGISTSSGLPQSCHSNLSSQTTWVTHTNPISMSLYPGNYMIHNLDNNHVLDYRWAIYRFGCYTTVHRGTNQQIRIRCTNAHILNTAL